MERYSAPLRDSDDLSVSQFCRAENVSKATFYKWKKNKLAPETKRLPGTTLLRITPQARKAWHAMMDARAKAQSKDPAFKAKQAALIEKKRAAGLKAAKSPRHISRRKNKGGVR